MNRSHAITAFGVVAFVLFRSARASADDVPAPTSPPPNVQVTIHCSDHATCSPDIHVERPHRPAFARAPLLALPAPRELAPVAPELRGPVDLPDGFSLMTGGFYTTLARPVLSFPTAYFSAAQSAQLTVGEAHAEGAMLSLGGDGENYSARLDIGFGAGGYSGSMTAQSAGASSSSPRAAPANAIAVEGDLVATTIDFRVGARVPSRYVALAAGTGLGASGTFFSNLRRSSATNVDVGAVIDPLAAWNVPLWASVDLKAACDWGIEVGASYKLQPLNFDESTVSVQAGLLWQPSSACSQGRSPAAS